MKKVRINRKHAIIGLCLLPAVAGAYLLLLLLPTTVYTPPPKKAAVPPPPPAATSAAKPVNTLYIPKLNLSIAYLTGSQKVLNENAWHRFPERGDPSKGGNFILSAHRFKLGLTPGATKRQSPFYHINRLVPGDKIFVDFEGKRYEYEVSKRFIVKPFQTEIEAPSETPKLTIYTCTFKGESDGREVIEARPIAEPETTALQ